MRHSQTRNVGNVILGLALLVALGCAEKTPEQKLIAARANYSASLVGWSVIGTPAVEPMEEVGEEEVTEEEAIAEDATEEAMEGEEEMLAEPEPTLQIVLLDILIRNENDENLPGITLDISQANEAGSELRHWRRWVDTSKILRGPGTQVDLRLIGVEIVEGYGFQVWVHSPVAEADRDQYQEFTELP